VINIFAKCLFSSVSALNESENEGYLLSCSNLILHTQPIGLKFSVHVKSGMTNGTLNEVCFEIKENGVLVSSGTILVMLQS
jgi:hypothetical protein